MILLASLDLDLGTIIVIDQMDLLHTRQDHHQKIHWSENLVDQEKAQPLNLALTITMIECITIITNIIMEHREERSQRVKGVKQEE